MIEGECINHKRALTMLFTLSDIKAHDYKQFPFLSFPNNWIKNIFYSSYFFYFSKETNKRKIAVQKIAVMEKI